MISAIVALVATLSAFTLVVGVVFRWSAPPTSKPAPPLRPPCENPRCYCSGRREP